VFIRCREQDKEILEAVQEDAVAAYRQKIVSEVKRFEGKSAEDIPCNLVFDTKYLPSIDDDEVNGCLGGFKLFAKKGRIVCS